MLRILIYGLLFGCMLGAGYSQDSLGLIKKAKPAKLSQSGNRPRGVPYKRAALYETGDTFACFDNSLIIPIEQVNDDYCDCLDGSDEPGTSACPNGVFHCSNVGHKSIDIPSNRVNDQICDCCDGTDEWDSGVDCANICEVLGTKHREEHKIRMELIKKGFTVRQELAVEGRNLRLEKESIVSKLSKEKEELSELKQKAFDKKTEIEAKETEAKTKHTEMWTEIKEAKKRASAQQLFNEIDINKDEKIDSSDIKSFEESSQNVDKQIIVDEINQSFADKENYDFESFAGEIYDRIRTQSMEKAAKEKYAQSTDSPSGNEINQSGEKNTDSDISLDKSTVSPNDDDASDEDSDEEKDVEDEKMKEDSEPPYDEATNSVIQEADEARKEFEEVERRFGEIEDSMKDAESYVSIDYGPDLAWLPLKDKCLSLDERQFTYKVCLFKQIEQKERNGHANTKLGSFSDWVGDEENKYSKQKYDRGQSCWNGPDRSAIVSFECGEETVLIEATEPAKCEYHLVVKSPAACPNPASVVDIHEEL